MKWSVLSWNILADAYIFPSSYPYVKGQDRQKTLSWEFHRRNRVKAILKYYNADVVCLQECEFPSDLREDLESLGYAFGSIFEKRCCKKKDGLFMAWKPCFYPTHKTRIEFDALSWSRGGHRSGTARMKRHNIAMIVALEHRPTGEVIVVGNTHLYWNPAAQDVKLYQARQFQYALRRVLDIVTSQSKVSPHVIAVGDFNSGPTSGVCKLLQHGDMPAEESCTKFVLDSNLRQLCRWLRSVGIDAEFLDMNPLLNHSKTQIGDSSEVFFERLRSEGRILLTTSNQIIARRGCPGCMLINPKKEEAAQESIFKRVINVYNIRLNPDLFYGRCVICNSFIKEIDRKRLFDRGERRKNSKAGSSIGQFDNSIDSLWVPLRTDKVKDQVYKVGEQEIPDEVLSSAETLYQCGGCLQVYWWGEKMATSKGVGRGNSSVRAELLVTHLAELAQGVLDAKREKKERLLREMKTPCLRREDHYVAKYDEQFASLQFILLKHSTPTPKACRTVTIDLVPDELLHHPEENFHLQNAFPKHESTNTTHEFDGCIDHIFYRSGDMSRNLSVIGRSHLTQIDEMLPSEKWPSDHRALVADFVLEHSL